MARCLTALVLCAHPDDEIFLCGKLRNLLKKRAELHIAWMTSGDLFGKGELRERELNLAADSLGIGSHNRYLFRLPDMGLVRNLDQALQHVTTLMKKIKPTHVFVPAYEGGHPDHDALNFVAHTVWTQLERCFSLHEFPLYNGTGPFFFLWLRVNSFPRFTEKMETHVLAADEIVMKSQIIRLYASQPRSMLPIRLTHWWQRYTGACVEPYAEVPEKRNYQLRPHPGLLFYERSFNKHLNMKYEQFANAIASFTE